MLWSVIALSHFQQHVLFTGLYKKPRGTACGRILNDSEALSVKEALGLFSGHKLAFVLLQLRYMFSWTQSHFLCLLSQQLYFHFPLFHDCTCFTWTLLSSNSSWLFRLRAKGQELWRNILVQVCLNRRNVFYFVAVHIQNIFT